MHTCCWSALAGRLSVLEFAFWALSLLLLHLFPRMRLRLLVTHRHSAAGLSKLGAHETSRVAHESAQGIADCKNTDSYVLIGAVACAARPGGVRTYIFTSGRTASLIALNDPGTEASATGFYMRLYAWQGTRCLAAANVLARRPLLLWLSLLLRSFALRPCRL